MMPVPERQHLDGHPEIARGLPYISACLHEPSRSSVTQNVRRDIVAEPRIGHDVGESLIHALHRISVPFDGEPLPAPFPAP